MVDIDELIKKINRRMTPKEAHELNKIVLEILFWKALNLMY